MQIAKVVVIVIAILIGLLFGFSVDIDCENSGLRFFVHIFSALLISAVLAALGFGILYFIQEVVPFLWNVFLILLIVFSFVLL